MAGHRRGGQAGGERARRAVHLAHNDGFIRPLPLKSVSARVVGWRWRNVPVAVTVLPANVPPGRLAPAPPLLQGHGRGGGGGDSGGRVGRVGRIRPHPAPRQPAQSAAAAVGRPPLPGCAAGPVLCCWACACAAAAGLPKRCLLDRPTMNVRPCSHAAVVYRELNLYLLNMLCHPSG